MTEASAAPSSSSVPSPSAAPAASASAGEQSEEASSQEGGEDQKRKTPKMRKIKVNGAEEFVDEDAVFRDYQKYKAGEQKLREAAEMRESVEQFYRRLMDDPDAVFRDPNLKGKRRELAEKWLIEELEAEQRQVDPREEENFTLKERLRQYEEKEQRAQQEAEQSEREKFVNSRREALSQTIAKAMEATHLSKHPESAAATLREMAVYMRAAKERGEEVTPDELVAHVHNNRFHQMYTLAHQYEGPDLIEFLGEEIVNRIRKADLERLRAQRNQPAATHRAEAPTGRGPQKFIDPQDERFAMRQR